MTVPGRPPFRADHVGSLLRPAVLRDAVKRHAAGTLDDAGLGRVEDDCIRAVVRLQEEAGLPVATDGEFRRSTFWGRFAARLDGITMRASLMTFRDGDQEVTFTVPYAAGPLARMRPLAVDEFAFLRDTTKVTAKITLPAPSALHFYRCSDFADPAVYPDAERFFAALAAAYRAEIAALAAAGCRYVQIDEVALALLCDPTIRAKVVAVGGDPDRMVALYVEALVAALADAPAGVTVAMHMCRGNLKGQHLAEGGYDRIAEEVFVRVPVNHFLLEYDTPRAGDFRPLRYLPKHKGVVLGLISSKTPVLEEIDVLRRRVDEAATVVDADRLALSPQCGFASTARGNPLTEDEEAAKLRLVVEAARAIWG